MSRHSSQSDLFSIGSYDYEGQFLDAQYNVRQYLPQDPAVRYDDVRNYGTGSAMNMASFAAQSSAPKYQTSDSFLYYPQNFVQVSQPERPAGGVHDALGLDTSSYKRQIYQPCSTYPEPEMNGPQSGSQTAEDATWQSYPAPPVAGYNPMLPDKSTSQDSDTYFNQQTQQLFFQPSQYIQPTSQGLQLAAPLAGRHYGPQRQQHRVSHTPGPQQPHVTADSVAVSHLQPSISAFNRTAPYSRQPRHNVTSAHGDNIDVPYADVTGRYASNYARPPTQRDHMTNQPGLLPSEPMQDSLNVEFGDAIGERIMAAAPVTTGSHYYGMHATAPFSGTANDNADNENSHNEPRSKQQQRPKFVNAGQLAETTDGDQASGGSERRTMTKNSPKEKRCKKSTEKAKVNSSEPNTWSEEDSKAEKISKKAKKDAVKEAKRMEAEYAKTKTPRPSPLSASWNGRKFSFTYTADGQLNFNPKSPFSGDQIQAYVDHARQKPDFRIYVQQLPSASAERMDALDKTCCYTGCPDRGKSMKCGFLRVVFDENPDRIAEGLHNPFKYAAAMHLYCFERQFDLRELYLSGVLRAEDRSLPKEKDENDRKLLLARDAHNNKIIDEIFIPWLTGKPHPSLPNKERWSPVAGATKKHFFTLGYALTRFHVQHETKARDVVRLRRNLGRPTDDIMSIDVIRGNLRKYVTVQKARTDRRRAEKELEKELRQNENQKQGAQQTTQQRITDETGGANVGRTQTSSSNLTNVRQTIRPSTLRNVSVTDHVDDTLYTPRDEGFNFVAGTPTASTFTSGEVADAGAAIPDPSQAHVSVPTVDGPESPLTLMLEQDYSVNEAPAMSNKRKHTSAPSSPVQKRRKK